MVEPLQQLAFERYSADSADLEIQAGLWRHSLGKMVAAGHDVQLHLHPQWHGATREGGHFRCPGGWNIADCAEADRRAMIIEGMKILAAQLPPGHRFVSGLRAEPGRFEALLRHLNFRRNKPLGEDLTASLLDALSDAYQITRDVRWFNEFLWYGGASTERMAAMAATFAACLDEKGRHAYPKPAPRHADQLIGPADGQSLPRGAPARVGLLGNPHHFSRLAETLEKAGLDTAMYFIPTSQSRLSRVILGVPLLARLGFALKGWRAPYRRLALPERNRPVSAPDGRLDVDFAIHRLGLIIRENLIEACGRGILNDHLGPLPWIRGRSSMEFTLLHGLPMSTTVHWVDEGIDTGPICATFSYPLDRLRPDSLATLRQHIIGQADARMAAAALLAAADTARAFPNEEAAGIRYFAMHPLLTAYVDGLIRAA